MLFFLVSFLRYLWHVKDFWKVFVAWAKGGHSLLAEMYVLSSQKIEYK